MRLTKRTGAAAGAATLLGAVAVYAATSGTATCGKKVRDVPSPPPSASADQVVRSYLDAVVAHDRRTVRDLSLPKYYETQESAADSPFCNWKSLTNLKVDAPVADHYERGGYSQAVRVWVNFDLHQKDEVSMRNGNTPWSYLLVRNADSERWRVAGEGVA
ncbi:DUF4829 domain-containing protein [Actinomadura barringtoniae]|uniref:DUF4829 domain-containing protein n=1 Tax=Actinomadura barringtoniae TaxID=1427535 RepID=A0A939P7N3_9ACTN|nr:DUF4829 domain-containing protein [Actinomadura barringtoniae]MBO2447155.1 DUF4829 domain-containing protein [Actinomadura barringtoniae]